MIPITFITDQCQDCGRMFQRAKYDEGIHRCPTCEQINQIRRIADALEYWIGSL